MEELIINPTETTTRKNTLAFLGKGSQLFAIDLLNAVLIIITLGFYYPWAKAKKLKYMYQHTNLAGSNFDFLGTGKELFKGYIKAILIFGSIYALTFGGQFALKLFADNELVIGIYIAIMLIIVFVVLPFFGAYAMFGTFRYRSARSTWRGILCGFEADKSEFIKIYLKGYYFIIGTYLLLFGVMMGSSFLGAMNGESSQFLPVLGMLLALPIMVLFVYATAWFQSKYYGITYGNLRLGNLKLNFKGQTSELFSIQLIGSLLISITLGIYYFWYKRNLYNYLVENLYIVQNEEEHKVKTSFSGGGFFKLELINALLLLVTLGLAYSWVYSRTAKFIISNIVLPESVDLDKIQQTEKAYTDATGEELSDIMDMGGIFF